MLQRLLKRAFLEASMNFGLLESFDLIILGHYF